MYHKAKFGCKQISSSVTMVETVIIWLYKSSLWLWSWRQQISVLNHSQVPHNPLLQQVWLNSQVAWKIFGQTGIGSVNIWCDLDREQSNLPFSEDTLAHDDTTVGSKRISSSEDTIKTSGVHEPSLWPWPWSQQTNLFRQVRRFEIPPFFKHFCCRNVFLSCWNVN